VGDSGLRESRHGVGQRFAKFFLTGVPKRSRAAGAPINEEPPVVMKQGKPFLAAHAEGSNEAGGFQVVETQLHATRKIAGLPRNFRWVPGLNKYRNPVF